MIYKFEDYKPKSRLIIRDASSDSIKSEKRISVTRKSSSYPKNMSRLVISIRQDMDPSNILDNIEEIDLEIDKVERNIPSNLPESDMKDVNVLIEANRDLRSKVNEVSELVKETLVKINVRESWLYHYY